LSEQRQEQRINHRIRVPELRVISETGEQLGILPTYKALERARDLGLDLVEINPHSRPPVAKIMDYGKFKYQQQKREKESKKAQVVIKIKEVKLRPNIDQHDFETKLNQAREFLTKGNKVKLSIQFRGREVVHRDLGKKVLDRFCQELQDVAVKESETPYDRNLKSYITVLAPQAAPKRPKPKAEEVHQEK
jgi:translation initiation factor IF-3